MREGLIITAVGNDRPGIVDRVSGLVYSEGCNLEDSRMAILGGSFALIVLVTGSNEALERLGIALPGLGEQLGLSIDVKTTRVDAVPDEPARPTIPYRITAVSIDHPGIVHKISRLLAASGVNVAALDTRVTYAPTTGTPVFALTIEAQVPGDRPVAELRTLLETLADEENLDLDFHAVR